jgi:hypothetical protein
VAEAAVEREAAAGERTVEAAVEGEGAAEATSAKMRNVRSAKTSSTTKSRRIQCRPRDGDYRDDDANRNLSNHCAHSIFEHPSLWESNRAFPIELPAALLLGAINADRPFISAVERQFLQLCRPIGFDPMTSSGESRWVAGIRPATTVCDIQKICWNRTCLKTQ